MPPGKIRNLSSSNCWKCIEIVNPTTTTLLIFHDSIRRTFLAPAPRTPPAYGPAEQQLHEVHGCKVARDEFWQFQDGTSKNILQLKFVSVLTIVFSFAMRSLPEA